MDDLANPLPLQHAHGNPHHRHVRERGLRRDTRRGRSNQPGPLPARGYAAGSTSASLRFSSLSSSLHNRLDQPTVAVAALTRRRDPRSIHPPTETKIFTGEGLLYSIPINDDRRGSRRVSKILRVVLPIALIVVVYTREPMGTLFGYNAFSLIPLPIWLLLLVTLGGANAASAFTLVRTERARHLAFWGLTLKLCFLPIFLVNLFVVAFMGGLSPFSPAALALGLAPTSRSHRSQRSSDTEQQQVG